MCAMKTEVNTIVPLNPHNHPISHYKADIFDLKSKCISAARSSRDRLSKVFKQVVRDDPAATLVSYKSLEATMYRARREIEPPIPRTPIEFLEMIPLSQFGIYFKGDVQVGCDVGIIFFSDNMATTLSEVEDVYFDGTFYTVPSQFYQLWTIFGRFQRHVLPVIHCILTSKKEELYTAILAKVHELIPQLIPLHGMSDWEKGARNAVKKQFPGIYLRGCHFHYSQSIWRKVQKLGLSNVYHSNQNFRTLIRAFMSVPFLAAEQILSTYNQLGLEDILLSADNMTKITILKKYMRKQWLSGVPANELSIFDCKHKTNNGAENYHGRLKRDIIVSHPRIWLFIEILNNTIQDTDLDIERLSKGIDITRNRKLKDIENDSLRSNCKQKLESGEYSPIVYLHSIANSTHIDTGSLNGEFQDDSSSEVDEDNEEHSQNTICCVCLLPRESTVIFLPCRHAKCCEECSAHLEKCPICRCTIEDRFNIFT